MPATYRWNGLVALATDPAQWTLIGGSPVSTRPHNGDTAIVGAGTVQLPNDATLNGNTIDIGGLSGAAGLSFIGDNAIGVANPSIDSSTLIQSAVPGQSGAETTVLTTLGQFLSEGTILANGPAGSSFTLNIQPNGTGAAAALAPGYFINAGIIQANAGNSMTIAVAGTAALFNAGSIIANGGSVFVNVASSAIYAGYAGIDGIALIENGGTIETNVTYPSTATNFYPLYLFGDGVSGDTLKLDNVSQFTGAIRGFRAGDTIDLGAALSVGTIVYGSTLGTIITLQLENAAGTVLASLSVSGIHNYGTFALAGGSADGFTFTTGANGDTLLTTSALIDQWNNTSGTWQTAANWSLGVPGLAQGLAIGQGSTAAFTLTTGSSPVLAPGIFIGDPNALVQITSSTTLEFTNGPGSVAAAGVTEMAGTLEVTAGNTLTSLTINQYSPNAYLKLDAGSVLDLLGGLTTASQNNGTIAINSGNSSAARIAGSLLIDGGTLNAGTSQPVAGADGGSVYIGYGYPGRPAQATVQNGGVVTATFTEIGSDPASYGTLTLTGAATSWTDQIDPHDPLSSRGFIEVGRNAFAGTTPAGDAQPPVAGTALLTVTSGATLNDSRAFIASSLDTSGAATVSSGGVWNVGTVAGGYLNVSAGGQGTLAIQAGGTVNVGKINTTGTFLSNGTTITGSGIGLGFTPGASGTIAVDGTGSILNDANGLSIGRVSTGNLLQVTNGGSVAVGRNIAAGVSAGSSGTVAVSGTGSRLTAAQLIVGQLGTGVATVQNSGGVTTGALYIGGGAGAPGAGASGTVALANFGSVATGALSLWNGSTVSVDANSALDLGAGAGFIAGQINVESGHSLIGSGVVAASVTDNGAILAGNSSVATASTGGKLEITGAVSGSGTMTIGSGATLQVDGSISSTPTIVFTAGTPETLILGAPPAIMTNSIAGFVAGDKIDFAGTAYKSSYRAYWYIGATGGTLQVVDTAASNAIVESLAFTGAFSGTVFTLGSDGGSGFNVSIAALAAVAPSPGQVVVSNVPGQAYAAYEPLYANGVFTGIRYSYPAAGQAYGSYNYDYSAGGAFIGSSFYYTNIAAQAYTGNTIYYDPLGNVASTVFTGLTGAAYSSYEYDFVGGVFAGSKYIVTSPQIGATYSSYELDYNPNSSLSAEKFFFTNIVGQSYTTEEEDFSGAVQLSRIVLTGFTSAPYASLELDYNAGSYTGFKVFYTGQSGLFTNIEEDVTSSGAVTKVVYSGPTTTPYSSVEQDYSAGALTSTVYNFTGVNVAAAGYLAYAYHVTQNAAGATTQELFDLNNGGHAIYAFADMQFLSSQGSDIFVGQTFGNETFILNPIYGQATFADFASHLTGATHDTIQFSSTEFATFNAMSAATTDSAGGARIVAPNGDTVTLSGVTKAQILANPGDFTFV